MARPLSATDDEILEAAERVVSRRGLGGFCVSEVAREVGLSRAAISLRFKGAEELKRVLVGRHGARFEAQVQSLEVVPGARGLLAVAETIGAMARSPQAFAGYLGRYSQNVQDPVLLELEERRGRILRSTLARLMPDTAIGKDEAVDAFMAHLTGSLLNWQSRGEEADGRGFLRKRTLLWLRLVGIPIEEDLG